MSFRYGNREQITLFPQSVQEYVKDTDPVRAYDAIVESFDFFQLGIDLETDKVGNPQYDPKAMLKLLLYGYSYGIRSSRKLERAIYHNISFIWLMGGLKPDHKTIAEFRRKNKRALIGVMKQCARICIELDLIEGNTLFVDGTKMAANASLKATWDKKKCERNLKAIDRRIEVILEECEAVDNKEEEQGSLVKMEEKLKNEEVLKAKIKVIQQQLEEEGKKSHNTTDSQCVRVKNKKRTQAGYNSQVVTDEKNGLIVHSDVVTNNNDVGEFSSQINQANETLGKKCKTACADAGYANTDELEKIDIQNIDVIVPSTRQATKKKQKPFSKSDFQYDRASDSYQCPQGHRLIFTSIDKKLGHRRYKITNKYICRKCCYFGQCTSSKNGRRLSRLKNEHVKEKLESFYLLPKSQEIYKLRKQKAELPFGYIKYNLKTNSFLLRGLKGVQAEFSLLTSCFNIIRMIKLKGVNGLIDQLI